MNIQVTKFEAVPGTVYKVRTRPLADDEKGKHCYICVMAKAQCVVEAKVVTRSDRKVTMYLCLVDRAAALLKLAVTK